MDTNELTVEEKGDVDDAREMGQRAFENGKTSIPAADKDVMNLVEKYSLPDWSKHHVISAIFESWSSGWHTANLASE